MAITYDIMKRNFCPQFPLFEKVGATQSPFSRSPA